MLDNLLRWMVLLAFGSCGISTGRAATQLVFDFESIVVDDTPGAALFDVPLVLTSGGLALTIAHESNLQFAVNSRSQTPWVARYDSNALSAFNGSGGTTSSDPGAFILDFDHALSSIFVDMGDFGQDSDDLLIEAFSGSGGSGASLGSDTGFISSASGFQFATVGVTAPGIRSVRMIGGSATFPNSVFYDNITVITAIPEPGFGTLLSLGLVGLITRRRHPSRHHFILTRQR